ncbi:MAG: hypothetical protein CO098_02495 [Bacteroidetes bacterium CG_4_9_14_3_um_filter_41_19]|nr:MAG: hypothetical protein CO098_02495 [Bacteroidetes bacterium CG_4_9_14_3_um_filter_41_19]
MKVSLIFILLLFFFSASQCKKEGDDCHRSIRIVNNSDSTVIYSTILYNGINPSQCLLTEDAVISPKEYYIEYSIVCLEDRLESSDYTFFIVDPQHFNDGGFYSCDSIEFKNKVLKHYVLTLDDLKNSDFVVTYQ